MKNDYDLLLESLPPMAAKKAAVMIGRFNPPTSGHYEVINHIKKFIRENASIGLEANPIIMVIGGNKSDADKSRNPLTVEDRIMFMQSSGKTNGAIFLSAPNAFAALSILRKNGYEPIAIAAGSDRIDDYKRILDDHFLTDSGKKIKHYKIELEREESAIETNADEKQRSMDTLLKNVSSGEDLDVGAISASLARRAVELGYQEEFAKIVGLENKPALAKKMFNKIKSVI